MKSISGEIEVDNDYIEDSVTAVESDFASPVSYKNPAFNCSMERIHYIEIVDDTTVEVTSVSDSGGTPRFNITDADLTFVAGKLARLVTNVPEYNGDFVVTVVTSTYIEVRGLEYVSTATGYAILIRQAISDDDNVYLFSVIRSTDTDDIFDKEAVYLNDTAETNFSIAFFNMLRLGRAIESSYTQGLALGEVDGQFQFQETIIDKYWTQFSMILQDPVKLIADGNLPIKVYNSIDFLRPISIRTRETSNLYYVNKITGYEERAIPCEMELIKLP